MNPFSRVGRIAGVMVSLTMFSMLASCGGGGGGDGPAPPPGTAIEQSTIFKRVVGGPNGGVVGGATVCLDANSNDVCDAGEPSALTDANGVAQVPVPATLQRETLPWIALVPANATDALGGVVGRPYILSGPDDASGVISPYTAMVQIYAEAFGADTATATAAVADLLQSYGIAFDPLADYSALNAEAERTASAIARLLVLLRQELIGQTGASAGFTEVIDNTVLNLFGEMVALAADASIAAISDPQARLAAYRTRIAAIAEEAGLTAQNIANVQAAFDAPLAVQPGAEVTTRALRYVNFVSPTQYDFSLYIQTPAQKVPDAAGLRYFTEQRRRSILINFEQSFPLPQPPVPVTQTWGEAYQRDSLIWTGSEWFDCPENFVHEMTTPDEDGAYTLRYCKAYQYRIRRSAQADYSGYPYRSLLDMLAGGLQKPRDASNWPDDAIPAAASLPKGARVTIEFRNLVDAVDSLSTVDKPNVLPFGALCTTAFPRAALRLEELLQLSGTRCQTGLHIGSWDYALLRLSPGASGTVAGSIAASFSQDPNDQRVTYWRCDAAANCGQIGSGTFSVDQLGDARVLHLSGQPEEVAGRSFVERGGTVFYGSREKAGEKPVTILNQIGTDALLPALGLQ